MRPLFCILQGLFSRPLKHWLFWAHILRCAMCSFSVSFLRLSQYCFLVFSYSPFFGFLLSQTSIVSVILIIGIWVSSLQTCSLILSLYLLLHSPSHTRFCVFLSDEVSHVAQASPTRSPSASASLSQFCHPHSFCLPTFSLSIFPTMSYVVSVSL